MSIRECEPRLVVDAAVEGFHNIMPQSRDLSFRDLSTIMIVPCGDQIPTRVVQSWMQMMTPMNQKFVRIFAQGMEVGKAYQAAIRNILAHPELSKFKYILTVEHDNMMPPDGLLKLYDSIGEYDAISGLYWTKGEGGMPMCYGKPDGDGHAPFIPEPGKVTECNGIGQGFALFKMDMFKDDRLPEIVFETVQDSRGQATQDLQFCSMAKKLGYRFAVDPNVRVGHYDLAADMVW